MKFTNHPVAAADYRISCGKVYFTSYDSIIAIIDNDGNVRFRADAFDISATTRKHIGWFLNQFVGLDYQTAKRVHNDGYMYNMLTGEVTERKRS